MSSDRGRFWCSVTLAGVIVTMPAGVPVTAKLTVMSALGESHSKPQPGVFVPTARACGALRVVREVGRSKQQSEWTKRKVGVTTSRSSVLLAQPVAVAVILAGEPGAVGERPEAGNATWVDPARTLMDPGTASLVGAELARLTVSAEVMGALKNTAKLRCRPAPTTFTPALRVRAGAAPTSTLVVPDVAPGLLAVRIVLPCWRPSTVKAGELS